MDDGKRVIAKVPNPNAGRPYYTTASEVATMDFTRTVLQLPTPKVYAWHSKAAENLVGAEFIIMEEARGVPLSHKWPILDGEAKLKLVEKIVEFEITLTSTSFSKYGSLYYTQDLEHSVQEDMLYNDATGTQIFNSRFPIGPTTDHKNLDEDRADLDFDRGPWTTAEEYVGSIGRREIQCVNQIKQLPRPLDIFNGPGLYQPGRTAKPSVLNEYLKVAGNLLPADRSVLSAYLWHNDLHNDNIFVDPQKPPEITCLIDWQSAHVEPLVLQVGHPAILDFEGLKSEGICAPSLPNDFDDMDEVQQRRARSLLSQQALFEAYEILSLQKNKKVYHALAYQKGLGYQIIALAGNLLHDGEPLVKGQLMQAQREWQKSPAVRAQACPPCPLHYTSQDLLAQEQDLAKWMQGLGLMTQIIESLGTVDRHWYGWVKPEEYGLRKEELDNIREHFLDDLSETQEDRPKWLASWPFKD